MSYRIAMLAACPYPVPQGSQVLLHDTALAVQRLGHDVRLVVYGYGSSADPGDVPIVRCAAIPGAKRVRAGPSLMKPALDAALVMTLRRLVRRERIDIVHAHNYEALLLALAAGTRPIVYHAHNAMSDELPFYFGRRLGLTLGGFLDRQFPRRANWVIALHETLAEYLVACGCRADSVSVIPPPADERLLSIPLAGASQTDDPCHTVLYMGNQDAYQNLDFLSRVMQRVCRADPAASLCIVTHSTRIINRDNNLFSFSIASDFESLQHALEKDAVVVCPRVSWSGYPIKVVNAMAAGRPIVACKSCAHGITNEMNGLVVPDNDDEAFASAIMRLLSSAALRRQLGAAAREAARLRHGPSSIAAQVSSVYDKVCAARPSDH